MTACRILVLLAASAEAPDEARFHFWDIPDPTWHWPVVLGGILLLGGGLTRAWAPSRDRVEALAWALGLGFIAASFLTFLGALLGGLHAPAKLRLAILAVAGAASWLLPASAAASDIPPRPSRRWSVAAGAVLALALSLQALALATPPLGMDERSYQLVIPAIWRDAQAITAPLDNFHYAFRNFVHALLAWTDLGRGIFLAPAAVMALGAYCAGRRLGTPAAGIIAALLVLGAPITEITTQQSFMEPVIGAAFVLALLAWLRYRQEGAKSRDAALVFACLGFAASCKLSAHPPALLAALAFSSALWRTPLALRLRVRSLAIGWAWLGVFPITLLVLNWRQYGNPVYPYFSSTFGGEAVGSFFSAPPRAEVSAGLQPWSFLGDPFHWSWGPTLLPLFLAALLLCRKRWMMVVASVTLTWAVTLLLGWRAHNTNQIARFLSPALPIFAVMAALSLPGLGRWRQAATALVGLGALVGLAFTALHGVDRLLVLTRQRTGQWYLERSLDGEDRREILALRAANGFRKHYPNARIAFTYGVPPFGADLDHADQFVVLPCHGGWLDYGALKAVGDYSQRLRERGVHFLVVGKDPHPDCPAQRFQQRIRGWDQARFFTVAWSWGDIRVLRVTGTPPAAQEGPLTP